MSEIVIFENAEFGKIRTIIIENEPWFVATDIAFALGYEKPNNAVNMHCKKINKFNYPETGQPLNIIGEADIYRLIMRSKLESAERFQDWVVEEVLPAIRKNGSYTIPGVEVPKKESFELELIGLKYVTEIMEMASVSRLGLIHKAYDKHEVDKSLLPMYVEKKRLTFSASKLLADLGKPLSAVAFNKLMISEGYLEEKSRPSVSKGVKIFKVLTTKGLAFGENLVSPKNDRETQPHYYEDTFSQLVNNLLHLEQEDDTEDLL